MRNKGWEQRFKHFLSKTHLVQNSIFQNLKTRPLFTAFAIQIPVIRLQHVMPYMKILKKTLTVFLILLLVLAAATFFFMQQKTFGKNPSGSRLERIQRSPNYRDGAFQNPEPTEEIRKGASMTKMLRDFLNKPKDTTPPHALPSVKTDLKTLSADKPVIVWFGHSSYLLKVGATTILVDPVFSGNASPVRFFGKSFPGSDVYTPDDMPPIDYLILTHDHYDHLDYQTIVKLIPKVKHFYAPLGVGSHLEYWGIPASRITELDWWQTERIADDTELTATPARHFSGRGITRNKTLWTSYVLRIKGYNFFLGGDSGYGTHFKTIGERFGPFDMAFLETGQYGADWPYIHTFPEETVTAAKDLKANVLLPVHWGKFALALHGWNEPIRRLMTRAAEENLTVAAPMIGEAVTLGSIYPTKAWWEKVGSGRRQ
jgi:L-ascorbate metabolism protein UlaG (beta-lactamase superfamily)